MIKSITIHEHFTNISVELDGSLIVLGPKVIIDGSQVDGLLDDIEVSGDIELDRVHWLEEGPGRLVLFNLLQEFHAGLHLCRDGLFKHVRTPGNGFILFYGY